MASECERESGHRPKGATVLWSSARNALRFDTERWDCALLVGGVIYGEIRWRAGSSCRAWVRFGMELWTMGME